MKTNVTHEVIARIAGPGLVLAAVFALVLAGSSVVRAQASATSPAVPAATPAKAAPAAQAGHPAAPAKRQPGGMHEGIKVHGHWMIEVRRPNGKLVSHTEFENMLYSLGGSEILPGFFTGSSPQWRVRTPGEWGILLGDPTSSPCTASIPVPFNSTFFGGAPGLAFSTGGFCVIAQLAPPAAIYPLNCSPAPNSGCSYNLLPAINSQSNLTLTGSVLSASGGTISQVQTILSTCGGTVAPAVCATETSPDSNLSGTDLLIGFTAAGLPQGPPPGTAPNLCGETGQVSCAVTVPEAGDTINVTVTISFQ
ncbi:MAG: hypothetical protein ABSA42_15280 [Terracidiphilus sp.]|jgi:hypothetical protein